MRAEVILFGPMVTGEQLGATQATGNAELPRRLGFLDALSIVVGIIIGAGIFLVPNLVARELQSPARILWVWVFAGVISFFGALACAELGTAFPATGGQYVFLREMYGPTESVREIAVRVPPDSAQENSRPDDDPD